MMSLEMRRAVLIPLVLQNVRIEVLVDFGCVSSILFFNLVLVLSVEGDLFESYIKRMAKVKDSGDLIPGHCVGVCDVGDVCIA